MSTGSTVAPGAQAAAAAGETRKPPELGERDRLVQDLFDTVNRVNETQQALVDCEQRLEQCQLELEQVYGSISWRVTLPLRKTSLYARRLFRPREMLGAATAYWVGVAMRHPKIRGVIRKVLDRFPSLRESVRKVVAPVLVSNWSAQEADYARTMTLERLPEQARSIYQELKSELAVRQQS